MSAWTRRRVGALGSGGVEFVALGVQRMQPVAQGRGVGPQRDERRIERFEFGAALQQPLAGFARAGRADHDATVVLDDLAGAGDEAGVGLSQGAGAEQHGRVQIGREVRRREQPVERGGDAVVAGDQGADRGESIRRDRLGRRFVGRFVPVGGEGQERNPARRVAQRGRVRDVAQRGHDDGLERGAERRLDRGGVALLDADHLREGADHAREAVVSPLGAVQDLALCIAQPGARFDHLLQGGATPASRDFALAISGLSARDRWSPATAAA